MQNEPILISLSELARDKHLNFNKSRLTYYAKIGLITPIKTISRTQIYDKNKTIQIIRKIEKYQTQGYTLPEVKNLLAS